MSTNVDILANSILPQPSEASSSHGHTLIFYDDDSALLDGLSQSICIAIDSGNSAIIVATAAHHDGLVTHLRERCANAHTAIIEGRLFLLDADEILSKLMVNGQLDPDRAVTVMGNYIEMLASAARTENPQVFAFGELVSLLWERGNHTAALHLELLCTKLAGRGDLHLCCGYPMRLFPTDIGPTPILGISSRQTRLLHAKDIQNLT